MIAPRPLLAPIARRLPALALAFFALGLQARLPAGETAPAPPPGAWSFVQLCDTQLGMGGYAHDVSTFERAVQQINRSKPDFVVICGDLVNIADGKSWTDFKRIKAGFTVPCHCAAGNHDVGNAPTALTLKAYREQIGPDYYAVERRGFTFVVANTQLWKVPLAGESEKHDAWFRETLAAAGRQGRPIVVVAHYPPFLETPDEEENYSNLPREKRREILKLCEETGVVAFLSGHRHQLVVNTHQGTQFLSGETTSRNFDQRPMGFRWWDVSAQGALTHRFVKLEG